MYQMIAELRSNDETIEEPCSFEEEIYVSMIYKIFNELHILSTKHLIKLQKAIDFDRYCE